jgi:hypothetical protein
MAWSNAGGGGGAHRAARAVRINKLPFSVTSPTAIQPAQCTALAALIQDTSHGGTAVACLVKHCAVTAGSLFVCNSRSAAAAIHIAHDANPRSIADAHIVLACSMAVAVFVKGFIFTEGAWAAALRFCGHGRGALGGVCCGDCGSFDLPAQHESMGPKCGVTPYPIRSLLVQPYPVCSHRQPAGPTISSLFQSTACWSTVSNLFLFTACQSHNTKFVPTWAQQHQRHGAPERTVGEQRCGCAASNHEALPSRLLPMLRIQVGPCAEMMPSRRLSRVPSFNALASAQICPRSDRKLPL